MTASRLSSRVLICLGLLVVLVSSDCVADAQDRKPEDGSEDRRDSSVEPVRAHPRSVYKVDDVGLIIGGASEDAKAKVGRLRVQD